MGSGKTSAAIRYMNERPEQKFMFITPYLKEAERVKDACQALDFVEPSKTIPAYGFKKINHAAELVKQGRNIVATHQLFKLCTDEMLEDIQRHGYTLFIDENISVTGEISMKNRDIELMVEAGVLSCENDVLSLSDNEYKDGSFDEIVNALRYQSGYRVGSLTEKSSSVVYFMMPRDMLTSFADVFVLTYLFESQDIHHLIKSNNLPYQNIGVGVDSYGYKFCESGEYMPEYCKDLSDKIYICENARMNKIGESRGALSISWYDKYPDKVKQIKRHLSNYFNNGNKAFYFRRMWGTYSKYENALRGGGYSKSFVVFNERATNEYGDRTALAYPVNLFVNGNYKKFYSRLGIEVSDNAYALSVMVQWIWRSAIRNGESIQIYLPSKRMRMILNDWMSDVEKQYEDYAKRKEGAA